MKKRTALLLCLAAAAACGIAAYLLNLPAPLPALPESQPPLILLSRSSDEISAIAVSPPEGTAYPLVRSGEDFYLLGREGMALRSGTVTDMLNAAGELEAESTVLDTAEEAVELSHFGLSPAQAQVTITYTDGSQAKLRIGSQSPEETPQYYCMVEGDSRLYTVLAVYCEAFFHEAEYLRDFSQPSLDASLLDRIDISGALTLGMRYTPSGWLMDAPYAYPLSTTRTDTLLSQIESMAFEACLGSPQEVALADYGLDAPALTITLTQTATVITGESAEGEQVTLDVPARQYTLLVGNETGKSGVYVLWEGMVYKASNFLLGFWKELTVDDLLLRQPVNLLVHDLDRVSLTASGLSAAYQVRMVESVTENNQIATDEYGQPLYDVAVCREGETKDMDAQAFLTWYTALASLSPAGRLPEGYAPIPPAEKRAEIVLENQTLTRVISFYPYDALHDAMAVDGVFQFYVEKSWLDRVWETP